MKALLLAAGIGSRLRPLTDHWPKCLMPIGKHPLLEYWLHTLDAIDVKFVLVNTGYFAEKVKSFLSRKQFVNWVRISHETELLGTAGTLRANADYFRGHTTLLIHADNWCQCDFRGFVNYHLHGRPRHCLITMMTFDADQPQNCGIVETDRDGVVVEFYEKVQAPPSTRANAAVYLLQPEVIEWLDCRPEIKDFSSEVIPKFIGQIATWHNDNLHRDIGTLASLLAAQRDPLPKIQWTKPDDWQIEFEDNPIFDALSNNV